jgi:hypothetical protein
MDIEALEMTGPHQQDERLREHFDELSNLLSKCTMLATRTKGFDELSLQGLGH